MSTPRDPMNPGEGAGAAGRLRHVERAADAAAAAIDSGADRAREAVDRGVDKLHQGTQAMREGVSSAVERAEEAAAAARSRLAALRQKSLTEFGEDVSELIGRHPGKAIGVALVVGFLLGATFGGRRSD